MGKLTTAQGTRSVLEGETCDVSPKMARRLCFRGTDEDPIADPEEPFQTPEFTREDVEDSTKKELHSVLPNDISEQYDGALKEQLKSAVLRYYGFSVSE